MIRYYEGVEGSGKSCMMTRDLYRHYMNGGRVWAFPGYEVYGNTKKQILSEVLLPEQIFELLVNDTGDIRKERIAIAMDEVTNFFSHHNWQNKICDILNAVLMQRRKLGVTVFMTGPEFEFLPRDIRYMVHEVVHTLNAHSLNRAIPSGLLCKYYKEDMRGMLSHPKYRNSYRHKFYMKPWHKHFDTYAAVGYNQNIKVKIQNREVVLGPDGRPIEDNSSYRDNESTYINKKITIAAAIEELRERGIEELKTYEFAALLNELGLTRSKGVKDEFAARGVYFDSHSQSYKIRDLVLV